MFKAEMPPGWKKAVNSSTLTNSFTFVDKYKWKKGKSEVAKEYDEMNEAVLWALEHSVRTAHKHGITASICGQAPSMYPDLGEKLVSWGITSISVSPDVIDTVRETVAKCEKKLFH